MFVVKYYRWFIELPTKWDELTERDYLFLGFLFPFFPSQDFHVRFLVHCMKLRFKYLLQLRLLFNREKTADHFYAILTNNLHADVKKYPLNFLFEPPCSEKIAIPKFIHNGITYYGPEDEMYDVVGGEWEWAENGLDTWYNSKDENAKLNALSIIAAAMYNEHRLFNRSTRHKIRFDQAELNRRAEIFNTLPEKLKKAILLQYIAMRRHVINGNEIVFQASEGAVNGNINYTWSHIIYDVAGTANSVEDTQNMNLWSLLGFIGRKKQIARDHKK